MDIIDDPADNVVEEEDGWLLIPALGSVITDEDVRTLRDAGQR